MNMSTGWHFLTHSIELEVLTYFALRIHVCFFGGKGESPRAQFWSTIVQNIVAQIVQVDGWFLTRDNWGQL